MVTGTLMNSGPVATILLDNNYCLMRNNNNKLSNIQLVQA